MMNKRDSERLSKKLTASLGSFKVTGRVTKVSSGPVVTLCEFEPSPGTKVSKVLGLADDLALVMGVTSCRMAVIPGRTVIGIELPNAKRQVVPMDSILETKEFRDSTAKLAFALGKGIDGSIVIVDIAKMPHLLMAGTTGSGKSVAMNTLIVSILKRMTPEECRFIMIDPKQLELAVYADIPHLLAPVVTDSSKAVETLQWAVSEMENRYRLMAKVGVRNIGGYNEQAKERLPYIVVVIDEVADLMMVAGKEVEAAVMRLAQMARAAGIHVIMATQRPSVDVITGTIKANFPTRISFQVASKFDSRTILGEQGAEQLLGMGDMLYMSGGGRMQRVHGAFISDDDIVEFIDEIKLLGKPKYADAFVEKAEAGQVVETDVEYKQALRIVLITGRATAAYLQRELGCSYLHALELTNRMERDGVVGPADVGGRRDVLIPFD